MVATEITLGSSRRLLQQAMEAIQHQRAVMESTQATEHIRKNSAHQEVYLAECKGC